MKEVKYQLIFKELADRIKRGEYPPHTKLPSEHELVDTYQTSRETIRKALNLLSQKGYIQKIHRKGSVVLDINKFDFPISGLVSFKEIMKKMNEDAETIVHSVTVEKPNHVLQSQMNIGKDEQVYKVVRSRKIDGEAIILDIDYFLKRYVAVLDAEIAKGSIYEYLENEVGLQISFAKKEIVVESCTEDDKMWLDLLEYDHVVVVKNYVYLDHAQLFQYTESRHRLDKFRFVDFARR
ncbi:trehalose operon transcriptional repressor [Bacillus coahuilensis p1.1.43]|uniref:Trehalose operon repressor n=1 Tax=Bacillus coahuilensis p1.1.43 TaxID=1150625 RepID=A0A147K4P5_9BACI|nr:trehalose operon repressor [Bacillus coahuilensis]KUP04418.1 trehalose operon transcriptional repressor [Bacillus coahuilensis p1.1.43]